MSLSTYSPSDVIVSVAGLHTVTGYADGTFVKIRKETRPTEKRRAMGGQECRVYAKDEGFTVELSLMQSSSSNAILSMIYNVDKATRMGKFPLFIKDGSGNTTFIALTAWIEEIPDVVFSNKLEDYTWVLGCTDATINIGGNEDTSLIENALMIASTSLPLFKQFLPQGSLNVL